jgi:hypothetical protein
VTGQAREKGKDANIVVSEGDILDMKSSVVVSAFVQGRQVDPHRQTQGALRKI